MTARRGVGISSVKTYTAFQSGKAKNVSQSEGRKCTNRAFFFSKKNEPTCAFRVNCQIIFLVCFRAFSARHYRRLSGAVRRARGD
jgi:hypothetical protein